VRLRYAPLGVVLAGSVLVAAADPGWAGTAPPTSKVALLSPGGSASATVVHDATGNLIADVTLVLQNTGAKPLTLRFRFLSTAPQSGRGTWMVSPRSASLNPKVTTTVKVTLTRRKPTPGSVPPQLSGVLLVKAKPAASPPISVSVTGTPATMVASPTSATVGETVWCWRCDGPSAVVNLSGDQLPVNDTTPVSSTLLVDGAGHTITAKLYVEQRNGRTVGVITLGSSHHAGTYTGALPLDPAQLDSPVISVTAPVRYPLWWAIFWVGVGAIFGCVGGIFIDRSRNRALLRAEIRKAVKRYKKIPDVDFGPGNGPLPQPPWFYRLANVSEADTGSLTGLDSASLLRRTSAAKDPEDFAAIVPDVSKLRTDVERAVDLYPAWKRLREAWEVAVKQFPGTPVVTDSELLLRLAELVPPDDATEQALRIRIDLQARVLHAYAGLDAVVKHVLQVAPGQAAAVAPRQPATLYAGPEATRSTAASETLLATLEASASFVAALAPATTGPAMTLAFAEAPVRVAIGDAVSALTGFPVPESVDYLGGRLLAKVRALDWVWGAIGFIASVTVYAITIYSKAPWGTDYDVLSAVLAGFLGQATVNWKLFPFFRTYNLATVTAGTPPPAAQA
jgi:hypothetical protein